MKSRTSGRNFFLSLLNYQKKNLNFKREGSSFIPDISYFHRHENGEDKSDNIYF